MKKAFRLEGSQIKLREVKALVGQARYEHIIREARENLSARPGHRNRVHDPSGDTRGRVSD